MVVTWEPPPRETWNGNLLGYRVGYQEVSENHNVQQASYTFKSVEVRQHFGGEATIQGLSKYTTYNIVVQVSEMFYAIFHVALCIQFCIKQFKR